MKYTEPKHFIFKRKPFLETNSRQQSRNVIWYKERGAMNTELCKQYWVRYSFKMMLSSKATGSSVITQRETWGWDSSNFQLSVYQPGPRTTTPHHHHHVNHSCLPRMPCFHSRPVDVNTPEPVIWGFMDIHWSHCHNPTDFKWSEQNTQQSIYEHGYMNITSKYEHV